MYIYLPFAYLIYCTWSECLVYTLPPIIMEVENRALEDVWLVSKHVMKIVGEKIITQPMGPTRWAKQPVISRVIYNSTYRGEISLGKPIYFREKNPHGQNTWHSPQKVGEYKAYINQYKVSVPSTFTLVYRGSPCHSIASKRPPCCRSVAPMVPKPRWSMKSPGLLRRSSWFQWQRVSYMCHGQKGTI